MAPLRTLTLSSLLTLSLPLTYALTLPSPLDPRTSDSTIQWTNCTDAGAALQCAVLPVPLDYTDPNSSTTFSLELTRIPATHNSKGSVLLNFGGPGENSRDNLAVLGPLLQATLAGEWDLVTFNVRGTGNTLPFFCYPSTLAQEAAALQYPTLLGKASDVAVGTLWADASLFVEACAQNAAGTGDLLGTPSVARDMMQVVDALGEDGLLRYWGFSYGTALGATAAALFPDRVGRVVLDGVLNFAQYFIGWDTEEFTDTDAVFAGFFTTCAANPTNCALARSYPNATAPALQAMTDALIERIRVAPIAWLAEGLVLDYTTVKNLLLTALYNPTYWPGVAVMLDGLLAGNLTEVADGLALYLAEEGAASAAPAAAKRLHAAVARTAASSPLSARAATSASASASVSAATATQTVALDEALAGIRCGDKADRVHASSFSDILPVVRSFFATSAFGGDVEIPLVARCAQWRMSAKERYEGPFEGIETKNPVLVVSNTWDPVTPLVSARNTSAAFGGSGVLEQRGYGHTSLAQASRCTATAIRAYLENGTLPEEDTVCEVDVPAFGNATWQEVYSVGS